MQPTKPQQKSESYRIWITKGIQPDIKIESMENYELFSGCSEQ